MKMWRCIVCCRMLRYACEVNRACKSHDLITIVVSVYVAQEAHEGTQEANEEHERHPHSQRPQAGGRSQQSRLYKDHVLALR